MATQADTRAMPAVNGHSDIKKSGYLWKQGGSYKSWKKRYFILTENSLEYYKKEGDPSPKGTVNLTTGRGIRTRQQCDVEWPDSVKPGRSFGLAIESRTYYLYGEDQTAIKDWMTAIQQVVEKIGKPTNDHSNDPEGKPEGKMSKAVRGGSKMAAKVTKKFVKDSGLVDEDTAKIVEGVADAAENQASADRDASIADRLKMAGGDTAGMVGDNVDNEYVGVAANIVQEQCEADDDVSLQQRMMMAGATTLEGAADIVGEENEIAGGVLSTAAGVTRDQAEADEDMSIQQRLILAGGSTLEGVSGMVENEILADTLEVAGGVVKDQAEADPDSSIQERAVMAVGSTAGGVAGLDSMRYDTDGKAIARAVEAGAENVGEVLADENLSRSSSSSSN